MFPGIEEEYFVPYICRLTSRSLLISTSNVSIASITFDWHHPLLRSLLGRKSDWTLLLIRYSYL
jgi:hypothetical protein